MAISQRRQVALITDMIVDLVFKRISLFTYRGVKSQSPSISPPSSLLLTMLKSADFKVQFVLNFYLVIKDRVLSETFVRHMYRASCLHLLRSNK